MKFCPIAFQITFYALYHQILISNVGQGVNIIRSYQVNQ